MDNSFTGTFAKDYMEQNMENRKIFITGDTHGCDGVLNRFNRNSFPEQKEMTKDDHVIICGDWGVHWENIYPNGSVCLENRAAVPGHSGESKKEKYTLDWLEAKNFTTLFVDGNHECFPRLNSYPVVPFHGGYAHQIRPSVYHLMRGEVYEINGHKFFAFGGASSHDIKDGILDPGDFKDMKSLAKRIKRWNQEYKSFRVKNLNWWSDELPNMEEMEKGLNNLEKHGYKVDYVITHSPPASVVALLGFGLYEIDYFERYLEEIRIKLDYKAWFFGHMHDNRRINDKDFLLWEQIVRIM